MPQRIVEFHATKQLLLQTVLTMLEAENPGTLTSEKVLARARVSSGSLYHHFEDFQDLIEQALCIEFEDFQARTIDLLLMANQQAENFEEWANGVSQARALSHGKPYERKRTLRVWAVAYATTSERMKARLGAAQDRLNEKFVEFLSGAQDKGWVQKSIDLLTVGVFIQAYQFGSVIDDIATTKFAHDKWIDLLDQVARKNFIELDHPAPKKKSPGKPRLSK